MKLVKEKIVAVFSFTHHTPTHSMIMGTSVFFLGGQFCDVTKMAIKSLGRFGQNMKVKKV
jgi:hypothetical protein